jgi:phage-related protein
MAPYVRHFRPCGGIRCAIPPYVLNRVQHGLEPNDWKPLAAVGVGVREIRIKAEGAYRIIYLATRPEAVYVLHCFQKKTQKTGRHDIELAKKRFKQIEAFK